MKYCLLLLLAIVISSNVIAQESPRDEYTVFAKFRNYDSYVDYIAEHVKRPEHITSDAKGIFAITVLVDSTGHASVYKISKKISPEVDAEFVKTILDAPQWTPANFNGKPVSVYFTMQIGVEVNKATAIMTTDASVGKIYTAVELNPAFPGGMQAYDAFLRKTMIYPQAARENHIHGVVFIQFVIETDGTLGDLKILREPGFGLGAEAIRILKASPKWSPGMQKGKAVRVQFTVPVNFNLAI